MLCVLIIYISGGTYSLKSTPNDKFFEKLTSFCQKSAERKSLKKIHFVFCFDIWPGSRILALRLISQHAIY